jgi:hypothetical protein
VTRPGSANRRALALPAAGLAALALAGSLQPSRFFPAYLFSYLFWLGLSLGALSLYMIGRVSGGRWGEVTAGPFLAAAGVLPVLALMFLPLAFGMPGLYPWLREGGQEAGILARKAAYLNLGFFLLRAALYFAAWLVLARLLTRWSPPGASPAQQRAARRLSAGGLVLYGITGSFAVFDWIMSLVPTWYSTVFGAEVLATQLLEGTALGVLAVAAAAGWRAGQTVGRDLRDLGNLMLAFTLLWAYLAFSEFLTIWIADLPRETLWFRLRLAADWAWMGPTLALLLFALPFAALLFRPLKEHPRALTAVALVTLSGTLFNALWLVLPSLRTSPTGLDWLDAVTPLALGAVWVGVYRLRLRRAGAPRWGPA